MKVEGVYFHWNLNTRRVPPLLAEYWSLFAIDPSFGTADHRANEAILNMNSP